MYAAPLSDIRTALTDMAQVGRLASTDLDLEAFDAALTDAGRVCADVLAPLNRVGDLEGCRLVDGEVRSPTGFDVGWRALADGGWIGMRADAAFGGAGAPLAHQSAVGEMAASACLSLSLGMLLSQGAIDALADHGSEAQKALYLPKLVSGAWNGAMCLTEPQAGTDVGAIKTRAEPAADGAYRLFGGKIWTSWGATDVVENTVQLVLARLPDAPAGSKGLSLFAAPRRLPTESGAAGPANPGFSVVSLDRKMGIHGSPTCVMAYDGATAWLIGAPHGGLAAMFTMMNSARLAVGLEGVAVAERARQAAFAHARERRQGRTPGRDPEDDGAGPIIHHADVRRMLLDIDARTQAARGVAYECAVELDLARFAPDAEARSEAAAMGALLTPIAKAFGTDMGVDVANLAMQVHGGYGYIEDVGVAQLSRDVRITAIYEGANGVQAMDLVGRKLTGDGGRTVERYLDRIDRIAETLSADDAFAPGGVILTRAATVARTTARWLLAADAVDRQAGGVDFLRLLALTAGGAHLGRAAHARDDRRRRAHFRYWCERVLPEVQARAAAVEAGAGGLYALPVEA